MPGRAVPPIVKVQIELPDPDDWFNAILFGVVPFEVKGVPVVPVPVATPITVPEAVHEMFVAVLSGVTAPKLAYDDAWLKS